MKRHSLGFSKRNKAAFPPAFTTPKVWLTPKGIRATRIGSGIYNYKSHSYDRR